MVMPFFSTFLSFENVTESKLRCTLRRYVIVGNPRVTPEVTRDVCLLARMMAANLYFSQIEDLMFEVRNWP